ncbi:MAG TPA: class I SAM-dependent methyltransferase [Gemmatimonadales bacterium]|nr:class I SAM-dependent methyltransferase [Gemmatimonadales bacterium]
MLNGLKQMVRTARFPGSRDYWETRYARGGNSGAGSFGKFAEFKAEVINAFVRRHGVRSVIELGCGDGAQLALAEYPSYVGVDVSPTAVERCGQRFAGDPTKRFVVAEPPSAPSLDGASLSADLALSLDVIYHLVEDAVFERYMAQLFACATRFVIIYSSDGDGGPATSPHVRHRPVTRWVRERIRDWVLLEHVPNRYPFAGDHEAGSFADFFIYHRLGDPEA